MKRDVDVDSILLTPKELQIMKVIWDEGEATVKEVCNAVSQIKATAYTTVLTFMRILEEKGALAHVRSGRLYIYKPLLSRRQATRNHIHDIIVRFFNGCPEELIADVLENEIWSPEQLGDARNLLNLLKGNRIAQGERATAS
jgi:BlaI family penicillinase repressor